MDKKNFSERINLKNIKIDDALWSGYQRLVRDVVIPYQYETLCDNTPGAPKSECIENFVKAAKAVNALNEGKRLPVYPVDKWEYTDDNSRRQAFKGWVFQDSDLYKWLEAVSYQLIISYDGELHKKAQSCVDLICSAQMKNGYLDTLYIINDRDKIFTNLKDRHELYCFGHLAEAACAYYEATGEDKLLNAACAFADLICGTFNENGRRGYPGHELAELALVKLYRHTGTKRYLEAARFFITERGKKPYYFDAERGAETNGREYAYNQAHTTVFEQDEATGHAVRAVYLYSGMAAAAKEYGDERLLSACKRLWKSITDKKLYITGGIGAQAQGEAFSRDYKLPNDEAYCETCASIGLIFFAAAMSELEPKAEYADVAELALYNTVAASVAEDGKSFFYVNPLEVIPEACRSDDNVRHVKPVRQKWFGCACCPPNAARLLSSLGAYCVSENDTCIFIHQYIGANVKSDKADIRIISGVYENGRAQAVIKCKKPFTLALRIPAWSKASYSISEKYYLKDGYAYIEIDSDRTVDVRLDISIKLVKSSNLVRGNIGRAAVMRGAVVYCAEEADNGKNLHLLKINADAHFRYEKPYIIADGTREAEDAELYSVYKEPHTEQCLIKLVPYSHWGNRGENEMSVYLRI